MGAVWILNQADSSADLRVNPVSVAKSIHGSLYHYRQLEFKGLPTGLP